MEGKEDDVRGLQCSYGQPGDGGGMGARGEGPKNMCLYGHPFLTECLQQAAH